MNEELLESLGRQVEESFEMLGFLFPMCDESAEQPRPGESTVAHLSFDGAFDGEVFLAIPSVVLPELACNMLGIEMDSSPDIGMQHSALKELLNVVSGNCLPLVAGSKAVFNLGSPEVLGDDDSAHGGGLTVAARVLLAMDEGSVELVLCGEGITEPKTAATV